MMHHMGMHGGMMCHHGMMGMKGKGKWVIFLISKVLKMRDDLKLSDDQVKNLKSIRADLIRSKMKLMADIKIAKFEMKEAFSIMNPNFDIIRSTIKNIINMKLEKKMAMVDAFEKTSKVLTADQKKKFVDMMKEWMGKGEEGH